MSLSVRIYDFRKCIVNELHNTNFSGRTSTRPEDTSKLLHPRVMDTQVSRLRTSSTISKKTLLSSNTLPLQCLAKDGLRTLGSECVLSARKPNTQHTTDLLRASADAGNISTRKQ
jgi:hypothetical protein